MQQAQRLSGSSDYVVFKCARCGRRLCGIQPVDDDVREIEGLFSFGKVLDILNAQGFIYGKVKPTIEWRMICKGSQPACDGKGCGWRVSLSGKRLRELYDDAVMRGRKTHKLR